jgi:23S rRNA G2445 N2-methylase RlmL
MVRNVLRSPQIRIDARSVEAEFRATPITGGKAVKSVVEKFRKKYGARDVKKYYSKFDVAVRVELD